jgi:hypothetical protein
MHSKGKHSSLSCCSIGEKEKKKKTFKRTEFGTGRTKIGEKRFSKSILENIEKR